MKILRLTLKKKWFDMILSGEKKEEYREIKEYWERRLFIDDIPVPYPIPFTHIEFVNGYSKDSPRFTIEYLGLSIRCGKQGWGAEPRKEYFVLKLGNIIKQN